MTVSPTSLYSRPSVLTLSILCGTRFMSTLDPVFVLCSTIFAVGWLTVKGFRVNVAASKMGDVYCPFPTLLTIPTVDRIRTVSCGYNHTAVVSMDGR